MTTQFAQERTHAMTTRQHHEASRIQHRFGRTLVRPAGDEAIELDVIGDDGNRPRFRLVLGPHGHVLERHAGHEIVVTDPLTVAAGLRTRFDRDTELDVAVVSFLLSHRDWMSGLAISRLLDVDRDRVRRSLARLDAGALVESRGSTRDRQWRSQG